MGELPASVCWDLGAKCLAAFLPVSPYPCAVGRSVGCGEEQGTERPGDLFVLVKVGLEQKRVGAKSWVTPLGWKGLSGS